MKDTTSKQLAKGRAPRSKPLSGRERRFHPGEQKGPNLLGAVYANKISEVRRILQTYERPLYSKVYKDPINFIDDRTGMTALHIAVGRDHLTIAKYLVEHGAVFIPDGQGRMPTTVAAECEVSDEMCDFIVEAEAKAEGV
jgi:Ankyrin repeats (3 copies)